MSISKWFNKVQGIDLVPRDQQELGVWISGILSDAGFEDTDQNRFQVAAQVQHLCQNNGPRLRRKDMLDALHAGAVNKSAFLIMQALKLKEKAEAEAKAAADSNDSKTV